MWPAPPQPAFRLRSVSADGTILFWKCTFLTSYSEAEQVAVSAASAQHLQDVSAETISSLIVITRDLAGLHTHLHRTDNTLNTYAFSLQFVITLWVIFINIGSSVQGWEGRATV